MYISGDTAMVLREMPRQFPEIHTTGMRLGGTNVPGGLKVTMGGEQGADHFQMVALSRGISVHPAVYTVSHTPLSDHLSELGKRGLPHRVTITGPGQTIERNTPGRVGETDIGTKEQSQS